MSLPIYVDTKTLILSYLKELDRVEVSLSEYKNFLNRLYVELNNKGLLKKYQITYEVNADNIEYLTEIWHNIFYLDNFDCENLIVYLRNKNDLDKLLECNQVDDALQEIIQNICNIL